MLNLFEKDLRYYIISDVTVVNIVTVLANFPSVFVVLCGNSLLQFLLPTMPVFSQNCWKTLQTKGLFIS